MEIDFWTSALTMLIVGLVTAFTRVAPYLCFSGKRKIPEVVSYLGMVLPASIMIILVVYCLRSIDFAAFPFGLAELISVAVVAVAQIIRKNTFLSVFLGTACYMILIRTMIS